MLNELKQQIRSQREMEFVTEAVTKAADGSVKNVFLDNYEADVIGGENDPEIKKLVDQIPEYSDVDEETEEEIEGLVESLTEVPEQSSEEGE